MKLQNFARRKNYLSLAIICGMLHLFSSAEQIYIGVNGIYFNEFVGIGTLKDLHQGTDAAIQAKKVSIVASIFVNKCNKIFAPEEFSLACLVEANAGYTISNNRQHNAILSFNIGRLKPLEIARFFYSIKNINTREVINYISSYRGIMNISSIALEVAKIAFPSSEQFLV